MPSSPSRDDENENQASVDAILTNGVHRRNFLKFFAGAFAAAALPEAVEACGSGAPAGSAVESLATANNEELFTSVPIKWVTRKEDGLSLGFQFLQLNTPAGGGPISLLSSGQPGYIAITFPPQHVIEDAMTSGEVFCTAKPPTPCPSGEGTYPLNARASGTSRIVFQVPSSLGASEDAGGVGTFPYTLEGVLALCSVSQPVVAPNAGVPAPLGISDALMIPPEERHYESLSQARIDRVIARVDPKAAARVRRRALRATRLLNPESLKHTQLSPFINPTVPGSPVMPTNGQTSIELPFRVLMSPNAQTGWSFMSAPVISPNVNGATIGDGGVPSDNQRAELWHAKMALINTGTNLPDLSLGGLTVRALYTRDWDIYGATSTYGLYNNPTNSTTAGAGNGSGNLPVGINEPVANFTPNAECREALVLQSGNGNNSPLPPLNVNRLILSPIGGTLDGWADWTKLPQVYGLSPAHLEYWKQQTILGRDEFVECVTAVTVQPGGFSGTLTTINKRCDIPNVGNSGDVVGVLYSTTTLAISTPLVSFVDLNTASDYNTFPFRALEIHQTKFTVASSLMNGAPAFVIDPNNAQITVGMTGTDWCGRKITFTTPLVVSQVGAPVDYDAGAPAGTNNGDPDALWNGSSGLGQLIQFNGQRIAFAPTADGHSAPQSSYSADSTTFETTQFYLYLKPPSPPTPQTPANLVPMAKQISLVVEAVAHLQATAQATLPAGAPSPTAAQMQTWDYDQVLYAPNGFATTTSTTTGAVIPDPVKNPNEIFLTLTNGVAPPAGSTSPVPGAGPGINFTNNPAQSGGLAAPALSANALSRATGIMSGTVAPAASAVANRPPAPPASTNSTYTSAGSSSSLYTAGFNPGDALSGFSPQLFGFVPLTAIMQGLEGLASQFMPKAITKELSNAEQFLEEAMSLYNLLSNLVSTTSASDGAPDGAAAVLGPIESILQQVMSDVSTYGQLAQGVVPPGGAVAGGSTFAEGAPLTNAEMQAAAWMQSAVTQAQELIQGYVTTLISIALDAEGLYNDITGLEFDLLFTNPANQTKATSLGLSETGDLYLFLADLNKFVTEVQALTSAVSDDAGITASPESAAGAVMSYFGPILRPIISAVSSLNSFLDSASGALSQLQSDLAILQQGLDLAKNMSVEFNWKPIISGLEASVGGTPIVAFIPKSNQGFDLDIQINANASNGNPAGLNITIRLDSFAIAFGGSLPGPSGNVLTAPSPLNFLSIAPVACGFTQTLQNADVSLVFDHMQVQMLAGQKPDVDVVFTDIYFGGDLKFVETIKNLIPLDAFSDPPFVNVTTSGIQAGFSIGLPDIAIGMFSLQNMSISASLTIPFISTGNSGLTFEFDFCSIDNPFVVTVSMLGGGGFFSMWMDLQGLEGIALGIQVEACLALDFVIASGSISIEAGIFLVYWNPADVPAGNTSIMDPVTGNPAQPGWLIGGYLRLRGELDVCGIITISVELYLQITYSPTSGKCVASGFIAIDASLFFFSISTQVAFSRTFAGSNGDPTFAQMLSPGGVDPMLDPTLTSTSPADVWDPFAQYCMAYI